MSQLFLWNTSEEHAHLHPQQSPGSWEVKANTKQLGRYHSPAQCDAAPISVSLTHCTHNLSSDQNQRSLDQLNSPNCSWLMYQFKHKNTYTINQIKSNSAVSIFHGHSGSVAEASAYLAGTGDTYFQPMLCSANISHLPLQAFKTVTTSLLPGQDWGWYPYKAPNGKLPTGIPSGTHTLLAPLKLGEMVRARQFSPTVLLEVPVPEATDRPQSS